MGALIWGGAAVAVLGVAGLIWVGIAAFRANRAGLEPEALKARLMRILPWNLAALGVAVIGLLLVGAGLFFR